MTGQVMTENRKEIRRTIDEGRQTVVDAVAHGEEIVEVQAKCRVGERRMLVGRCDRSSEELARSIHGRRRRGIQC